MPAKIVVKSGAAAKTVFPIEEDLLRIGSDPSCDFVLPDAGLAPHIATVELLDGNFIVYNRSEGVLRLNNVPIQVRGSRQWNAGQELYITDQVVLRLEVEESPQVKKEARAPSADTGKFEPVKKPTPEADGIAEGERRQKQYIILGLLGVVAVILLLVDAPQPGSGGGTRVSPEKQFAELMQEWERSEGPMDELRFALMDTRFMLQEARIAEVRGDTDTARLLYGRVLDALIARRKEDGTFATTLEKKTWDFVTMQMGRRSAISLDLTR